MRLYPGANVFADYLALDVAGSHMAFYSVNPLPNPTYPVYLGFVSHSSRPGDFFAYHVFNTWVETGHTWQSPVIRVDIGQQVSQTAFNYRQGNQINSYPTINDKVGPSRFDALIRAPLLKMDVYSFGRRFTDWASIFSGLSPPLLIHPAAFQLGAFQLYM